MVEKNNIKDDLVIMLTVLQIVKTLKDIFGKDKKEKRPSAKGRKRK